MKLSEMLQPIGDKPLSIFRCGEQFLQCIGKSIRVAVRKSDSARSDCFRKSSAARADHDTATSNPFQRHHSKRFVVTRWNHQNLVAIEDFGKFGAAFCAGKVDPVVNIKTVSKLPQGSFFGTGPDYH